MKKGYVAGAMMMAVLTTTVSGVEAGKHLFMLSGQSNMAGLNPALSFTPAVEAKFGKENVTVVKSAQGGQPIRRWCKGWKDAKGNAPEKTGDLYDRLMGKVSPAIKGQKIASVTFVWMQGERDAREKHGEVYEQSFKTVVEQLEKDLGREDVNFVIGRLSDFDMKNKRYPHWTKVRDVQVKLADDDPRGAWVDTDDLNDKKGKNGAVRHDLHYTKEGYNVLGRRFADAAIELITKE